MRKQKEAAEQPLREPSARELRAIEAEWPAIAAELAVTDAEIAAARLGDEMSELERRRLRRRQAACARSMVQTWPGSGGLDGAA